MVEYFKSKMFKVTIRTTEARAKQQDYKFSSQEKEIYCFHRQLQKG